MPRRPARRELPAEATLFVGAAGRLRPAVELHLREMSEAVDAAVGAISSEALASDQQVMLRELRPSLESGFRPSWTAKRSDGPRGDRGRSEPRHERSTKRC